MNQHMMNVHLKLRPYKCRYGCELGNLYIKQSHLCVLVAWHKKITPYLKDIYNNKILWKL